MRIPHQSPSKNTQGHTRGMDMKTPRLHNTQRIIPDTPGSVLKTSVVKKNISKITQSIDKGPSDTKLGYNYTLERNVKGSNAPNFSQKTLLEGNTFVFSGYSATDYFEVKLKDGAKYVRKLVLGAPVRPRKDILKWGVPRLNGAVVQILKGGQWIDHTKVKFSADGSENNNPSVD